MNIRQVLSNLERVGEVATLAGLTGRVIEERLEYVMRFALDEGRTQMVYIRDDSNPSKNIVTIFSPCAAVKKGLFKGLSKEKALELLRLNEKVAFARFGIWETKEEIMVVTSINHLLDTLDPEEFGASAYCVAKVADEYERKQGKDAF